MTDAYTHDTLTQTVQLEHHNAIERNAGEVHLLYPPENPADDASGMINAALDAIGSDSGAILLASGYWRIGQNLVAHNPAFTSCYGLGRHTVLALDPGVEGFVLESTAARHSIYEFGDMTIRGGASAFKAVDVTGNDTGRQTLDSTWQRLWLLGQSDAAFRVQNAIYESAFRDMRIDTDGAVLPAYGFEFDAYWGFNANVMSNVTVCYTDEAALFCAGTQPNNVNGLVLDACTFEANLGQVIKFNNCNVVTVNGGHWEYNCSMEQTPAIPVIDFGNGAALEIVNTHVWPTGPGCIDEADDNRAWIIKANANGHAFHGAARGYIQFGQKVYVPGRVDMDCRQRMVLGPDGMWYTITPGQVVNLAPVA